MKMQPTPFREFNSHIEKIASDSSRQSTLRNTREDDAILIYIDIYNIILS